MLGITVDTLYALEDHSRRFIRIYGAKIHVYRIGSSPSAHRRYDSDEIARVLRQLSLY